VKKIEKSLWKARRLRTMGKAEIAHRVRQAFHARLEQLGFGLARPVEARGNCGAAWVAPLPREFDATKYQRAADAVLEGRFDVFALSDAALGFPPRWNIDPKSGTSAPDTFGKAIDYRDERLVGDIKYLWEPNRHLQFVTLAQAWHLTGQVRYASGCRQFLDSWFEQCPYPNGPNWTSSLELAIRLTNWGFAWQLLAGDGSPLFEGEEGISFRQRWLRSIREHCHYIAGHLSRFSSANNHLLGEYMGLFVGSVTWPLWPESTGWREQAVAGFERESLLQNAPDGVNREQAIYYQHEVMDMMLICALMGRANGVSLGTAFWERLERMMEFLAAVVDCAGNVPMIGDSDDALIVRFSQEKPWSPYQSLLATGAILFSRGDWKAKVERCDDKTRWLLGDEAARRFATLAVPAAPSPRRAFPDGGYYVLGARFGADDEVLAVVDCGPLGFLSIAAHGHSDALSFTLSASGVQLLVDPGTFAYHTQKKWRDYFRSTFAHNSVCVDGVDQSTMGGNFMWLCKAQASCKIARLEGDHQCFEGEHDGYRRLSDPVTHRRRITFDATTNEFRVEDSLDCAGTHRADVCWHFSEHCSVMADGASIRAVAGRARLSIAMEHGSSQAALIWGRDDPPGGWLSRSFDVKVPISTAVWSLPVRGPTQFVTIIRLEFD
jgi:Heparinase II/III-like protein/Heparinase II/III N-terminus